MDKVELLMDRTLAGLKTKVNRMFDLGYVMDGSFSKTSDGRWFMQSMHMLPGSPVERVEKEVEPKPNRAKKAPEKRSHHKKA